MLKQNKGPLFLDENIKIMTPSKIKEIRKQYGVTQVAFADLIGVKFETYRSWKEGRRYTSSPGYAILCIAERHPQILLKNRNKISHLAHKYLLKLL